MASSGPSWKVLRACLGPRMFLLDVAHCQRPGVAVTKDHTLGTLTQCKPAVSHLEARVWIKVTAGEGGSFRPPELLGIPGDPGLVALSLQPLLCGLVASPCLCVFRLLSDKDTCR